jgi:hypothetical protein
MFCEVLLYSRKKNSIKGKEKATWKRRAAKKKENRDRQKNGKETGEGYFSGCSVNVFYYALQLYLIYYKSGCGRRQIAEPPKIMCVVSF